MDHNFTILDGFQYTSLDGGIVISVSAPNDGSSLEFEAGDSIKRGLTDPQLTINGMTVGQMNRKKLHDELDAWLDSRIELAA